MSVGTEEQMAAEQRALLRRAEETSPGLHQQLQAIKDLREAMPHGDSEPQFVVTNSSGRG